MDAAFVTTPHFSTRGGIAPISTGKMRQIFDFSGFPPEFYRLDLFQHPSGKIPEDAVEYLNMVLNFMGKSDWKGVWNIPEKNYRAAAPEGGLAQFMVLAGATGDKFRAEVLSNEIMYDSVSMTTIDFR